MYGFGFKGLGRGGVSFRGEGIGLRPQITMCTELPIVRNLLLWLACKGAQQDRELLGNTKWDLSMFIYMPAYLCIGSQALYTSVPTYFHFLYISICSHSISSVDEHCNAYIDKQTQTVTATKGK